MKMKRFWLFVLCWVVGGQMIAHAMRLTGENAVRMVERQEQGFTAPCTSEAQCRAMCQAMGYNQALFDARSGICTCIY